MRGRFNAPLTTRRTMLYPLKFKPILKTAIWGGHRLPTAGKKVPRKLAASADRISESWEISGVRGNLSVAANGFLKSNNLEDKVEISGCLCENKCKEGPNIKINGELYSAVTPEAVIDLLNLKISGVNNKN